MQYGQLFIQLVPASGIELAEDLAQEGLVLVTRDKVTAAAQLQTLIDGPVETVVTLLDVAVFVRAARVGLASLQPVMAHQRCVARREGLGVIEFVHGRAQAVGLVTVRHATQLPEGVLQSGNQGLEALAEADRGRLPVGVGKDEMVEQMVEGTALNRDRQRRHVREIRLTQPARLVDLREVGLLGRPLQCPPHFDAALQGAQLAVREAPWILALQVLEQRLGLEPVIQLQHLLESRPYLLERIRPGTPGVLGLQLTG